MVENGCGISFVNLGGFSDLKSESNLAEGTLSAVKTFPMTLKDHVCLVS